MSTSGRLNNSGIDLAGEVKHRQKASATGGDSTLDDVEDEYNRPFQTDDQQVFLWHLANTNQRPRSIRPAFRLLGLFPSIEEATAHGRRRRPTRSRIVIAANMTKAPAAAFPSTPHHFS